MQFHIQWFECMQNNVLCLILIQDYNALASSVRQADLKECAGKSLLSKVEVKYVMHFLCLFQSIKVLCYVHRYTHYSL